ncbi:MAG: bifunctional riboflavin kinase/FAD synthetase [Bacteroidota bacterium]
MNVYRGLESFTKLDYAVVTTGTFDGVHIGHRHILSRLQETARKDRGQSVLLTFQPHPRMVLYPDDHGLRLLNTLDEKIALLEQAGIDNLIILPFTTAFSRTTSIEYVRDILVNAVGTRKLVIGYDHHFGRNREGSFEHLREFGPLYGFEVEEIPAQDVENVNVSSTKIRHALGEGDVETARKYLGYAYHLSGRVEPGNQLGRTIGYPTANLLVESDTKLVPAEGVYAVKVRLEDRYYNGMLNIGTRPTITANGSTHIEVNLFEFSGDLYGRTLDITFHARIRDEKKFENLDSLRKQLDIDKNKSLRKLA